MSGLLPLNPAHGWDPTAAWGWQLALAAFQGRDPGGQSPRSREEADFHQWRPAHVMGSHSLAGGWGRGALFGPFLVTT